MNFSAIDRAMMSRALDLARRGLATCAPNPAVGAIVARDGIVLGEGWHERAGEAHAEIQALQSIVDPRTIQGSTLYVTLEPCSSWGRTPPCTDAIVNHGIRRVVAATIDQDPRNAGQAIARLEELGIVIETGLFEAEARAINQLFFDRFKTNMG